LQAAACGGSRSFQAGPAVTKSGSLPGHKLGADAFDSATQPVDGGHVPVKLREMIALLKSEKPRLALATSAIFLSSGTAMAVPWIFGNVVDALSAGGPDAMETLRGMAAALAGVTLVGSGATFARVSLMDMVGQNVGRNLRKRLFRNLLSQELAYFDTAQTGELASRLSTDVHEVAEHLVESFAIVLTSSLTATAAACCLVYTSPQLSTVTLLIVPTIAVGSAKYSTHVKKLSRALMNALATSTQLAAEKILSIRTVRSFDGEGRESRAYAQRIDKSYSLARRLALMEGGFVGSMFFISNGTLLAVIWLGADMVLAGAMSVGSLASFCMYANNLSEAVSEVTEGISGIIKAQGAGGRLFALMNRKPTMSDGSLVPQRACHGHVMFEHVSFAYPTRTDNVILRDLSLTIEPGEVVAITGPSGCGKSTLAYLLEHMYRPSSGAIRVDGLDVSSLDHRWLRRQVVTAAQNPAVFSGTIAENIAYSRPASSMQDIEAAARTVCAHDFIVGLQDGYHTEVGEQGVSLSGGQRQRLILARALLADPKILIMDESTSALDINMELAVQESVLKAMKGKTVICITHHINILRHADRVVVLNNGTVVDQGTYEELRAEGNELLKVIVDSKAAKKQHDGFVTPYLAQ
jgi:ABC-type multidrug transport system fused ATPase/permease subunit